MNGQEILNSAITLTREEAQQVLDALEEAQSYTSCETWSPSMTDELRKKEETLRAKLSAPEPKELTGKEKIVYDILCSDETPPNGQHWEGFVAQKIVEALAQPEPEPVAWIYEYGSNHGDAVNETRWYLNVSLSEPKLSLVRNVRPLYTAPPQREWQGLTDEEIRRTDHHRVDGAYDYSFKQGAQWADATLREKNT